MAWRVALLGVFVLVPFVVSTGRAASTRAVRVLSHTRSVSAGGDISVVAEVPVRVKTCLGTLSIGTAAAQHKATVTHGVARFAWKTPRTTRTAVASATVSCRGAKSATVRIQVTGDAVPASVSVGKSGFSTATYDFTTDTFSNVGVVLANPSPDQDALNVQITVNLLSAAGQIVATEVGNVPDIPAATTFFYGGLAEGSSVNPAPATMQTTVVIGGTQAAQHLPAIGVTNVHVIPDDSGDAEVEGQVANTLTTTLPGYTTVTYVLFDAAGDVLGGGSTFLNAEVPPGGQIGFDDIVSSLPALSVASADASVSPKQD